MLFETAPSVESDTPEDEDPIECPLCGAERPYVRHEQDTVCNHCGYVRGSENERERRETGTWQSWWDHRQEKYSGFRGDGRVRMVGGFSFVY
jgi:ribosomal protein L37E